MRSIQGLIGILTLVFSTGAGAAHLTVRVVDQRNAPVADAVVIAVPDDAGRQPAPPRRADVVVVDQKNLMFVPYLEVLRPGDSVVFHNSDGTRHHVYSFSPAKAFEFVLAPGQSSAPLVLDKPGIVAVGCNIHDRMIAWLYISDATWITHSGARGEVSFEALPAGGYHVHVWQPRLRPNETGLVQSVTLSDAADTQTVTFKLALLPDRRMQSDREDSY